MKRIAIGMFWRARSTASSVQAGAQAANPANVRVTIDYRAAPAADVITALAAAAGVPLELAAGPMRPVTITLTNVRLRTAIDAVCDSALCSWSLSGTLKVTPLPSEKSAALPPRVSFSLWDTPVSEVFRALRPPRLTCRSRSKRGAPRQYRVAQLQEHIDARGPEHAVRHGAVPVGTSTRSAACASCGSRDWGTGDWGTSGWGWSDLGVWHPAPTQIPLIPV